MCISCESQHNKHKTITFGKLIKNKEDLLNNLKGLKNEIDNFNEAIEDIIKKLRDLTKNMNLFYQIYENIIITDYKNTNYQVLQNIIEINEKITDYSNKLNFINEEGNICNKFESIMKIYNQMLTVNAKKKDKIDASKDNIEDSNIIKNMIVKSKGIICPECGESCLMSINDYKIRLYDCINEHDTDEIAFEEFNNTQKEGLKKIKCNKCNAIYNNDFYACNVCKINLCFLCKNKHDSTHKILNYEDKNCIGSRHDYPYTLYCKSCKINLCISCETEHNKKHELISFGKMMINNGNLKQQLDTFKNMKNECNYDIKQIINKLNLVLKNTESIYTIFEDILNNDYKNKNYAILYNLNEINKTLFDYCKFFNSMNSDININNKFKNMMIIYDKIVAIDYIRIIYKIDKTSDKIKIFDANFVSMNKDRYKIIFS